MSSSDRYPSDQSLSYHAPHSAPSIRTKTEPGACARAIAFTTPYAGAGPPAGDAPQPDPNAEEVNFKGVIDEVGSNYIVVSGATIYYTTDTLMTFEDETGGEFAVGQQTEVAGLQNSNGTVMATEIQVSP